MIAHLICMYLVRLTGRILKTRTRSRARARPESPVRRHLEHGRPRHETVWHTFASAVRALLTQAHPSWMGGGRAKMAGESHRPAAHGCAWAAGGGGGNPLPSADDGGQPTVPPWHRRRRFLRLRGQRAAWQKLAGIRSPFLPLPFPCLMLRVHRPAQRAAKAELISGSSSLLRRNNLNVLIHGSVPDWAAGRRAPAAAMAPPLILPLPPPIAA